MILRSALILAASAAVAQAEIRFEDRSAGLPVGHQYTGDWTHFVGGGVAVFDCNGDDRAELFVAGGASPARLFVNETRSGDFAFSEGKLPELTGVTGAYPLDIDSDGLLDLYVLRVGPNVVLKGQGGCVFQPADWGLEPGDAWSTAFSATWEPGESWPTLAVGNYVDRADPEGPFEACDGHRLHRPEGRGYGAPMTLEPGYCALSILFSDWSRRGVADLRMSNDRHYYVRGGSEQMWRLDGPEPRVLGEAEGFAPISIWGMGIASRDLTGDQRPEVFLTSMGDQLLQIAAETGGYVAADYAIGTYAQRPHIGDDGRPSTGWHAEFADVNNDGLADLFIAKGNVDQMPGLAMEDPNNLLIQDPGPVFREVAHTAGVATTARSRGAALADLDADGRLDLVVVNRRAPLEVYRNVSEVGGFVQIQPMQEGANTRAVGAWVELRAEGAAAQAQEVTVGGGHAGGSALPLHFGLGAAKAAEFRVIWPGGEVGPWTPVAAGTRAEVWRADGALRPLRP